MTTPTIRYSRKSKGALVIGVEPFTLIEYQTGPHMTITAHRMVIESRLKQATIAPVPIIFTLQGRAIFCEHTNPQELEASLMLFRLFLAFLQS